MQKCCGSRKLCWWMLAVINQQFLGLDSRGSYAEGAQQFKCG